jgi:hypothetical protein
MTQSAVLMIAVERNVNNLLMNLFIKRQGQQMALPFFFVGCDYCNIFAIPKAGSEPVISFFNRANPFHRACLFCISVRNTIYVIKIEMLGLVSMARYRKVSQHLNLMLHQGNIHFRDIGGSSNV